MTSKLDIQENSAAWAAPTEADAAEWEALSRAEQAARMRALFDSAECNKLSQRSFAEIIAEARLKARPHRIG